MSINRRKFIRLAAFGTVGLLLNGCGSSNEKSNEKTNEKPKETSSKTGGAAVSGKKILVVYYSRTGDNYEVGVIEKGNTHIMADMIAEELGGVDTFEIKTVKEYAKDYQECTEEAKEEKAKNARPKLSVKVDNFAQYDTVFLGYPIWWSDLPMPVYTFLESYDWKGKTVIPFCTSAGDVMTGLEDRVIPKYAKGSEVKLPGLGLRGKTVQDESESVRPQVKSWLKELGYVK